MNEESEGGQDFASAADMYNHLAATCGQTSQNPPVDEDAFRAVVEEVKKYI